MSDDTTTFRAVSGCWSVDLTTDPDGKLTAVGFKAMEERDVNNEPPELIFRTDDPKSAWQIRGTALSLGQQFGDPSEHNCDDNETNDTPE